MSGGVVTAVDHLRELAGAELYRRNPFRLTGLPTDVNRRVVRAARQRVESGGVPAPAAGELAVPATEAELVAALAELGDPGRRIVGEVFWLWGTDKPRCGCTGEFHAEHDEAVRAHALALDLEAEGEELEVADALWLAAAKLWSELLRRAEFWEHLRHRVVELEDDGLDQTVLAALHAELPRALVMPLAVLAAGADQPDRLVGHARRWEVGASVVEEVLAEAAERRSAAPEPEPDTAPSPEPEEPGPESGEPAGAPIGEPESAEEPGQAEQAEQSEQSEQRAVRPELPAQPRPHGGEPVLPRQRGSEPDEAPNQGPALERPAVAYPLAEPFLDTQWRPERFQPGPYRIEQFPTDAFAAQDFNRSPQRRRSGNMTAFYLALLTAAILIAVVIIVLA